MENSESGDYMTYALLNVVSSVISKLTPAPSSLVTLAPSAKVTVTPTATLIPTVIPTVAPTSFKIEIVNGTSWVDIVGIILQVILIVATIYLGYTAWKSSETANNISKQQISHETNLRDFEHRIAALDKVAFVYDFFARDLVDCNFYNGNNQEKSISSINSVDSIALCLFKDDTYALIKQELDKIRNYVIGGRLPDFEDLKIKARQYMTGNEIDSICRMAGGTYEWSVYFVQAIALKIVEPILSEYRLKL